MRRDILPPALAVVGGAAGFGLRRWQLASAYDTSTQLYRPGASATLALMGLLVLMTALFLVLFRGIRAEKDFLSAYLCPAAPFMAVMAAAAFLILGSGLLGCADGYAELMSWRQQRAAAVFMGSSPQPVTLPAALLLSSVLCLPAAAAVLLIGRSAYRCEPDPRCAVLASFPAFAGLIRLFAAHLEHGSDPVLFRYGFALLALGLLTMAQYDVAAAFFQQQHPLRAAICALMGACAALIFLADRPDLSAALLVIGFALASLGCTCALLRNAFGPAWPERIPPEADSFAQTAAVGPGGGDTPPPQE